jgi:hypothetical protein
MKDSLKFDEIYGVYDELSETKAVNRVICSFNTKKSILEILNLSEVIDPYFVGQPFEIVVDNSMAEDVVAFSSGENIVEVRNIRTD